MTGTITAVDTGAGTITPSNGGAAVTISITASTSLVGHQTIDALDILPGDRLDVFGLALAISASQIVDNKLPTTSSSNSSSGSSSGGGDHGTRSAPETVRVTGTVQAITDATVLPLLLDDGILVSVKAADGATFSEVLPLTLAQITKGTLRAVVTTSSTGALTANWVEVTL